MPLVVSRYVSARFCLLLNVHCDPTGMLAGCVLCLETVPGQVADPASFTGRGGDWLPAVGESC